MHRRTHSQPASWMHPDHVASSAKLAEARECESGWLGKRHGGERADKTSVYHAAVQQPLPAHAKNYFYLLVPGLFTKHYGPAYMRPNIEHMKKLGLNVHKSAVNTDKSVEENAAVIREEVLAAPTKVVLIGHSKGGVDLTAALALYGDELYPKVHAIITVQTPFGGTPIVDFLECHHAMLKVVQELVDHLLKGDDRALTELSYASRQGFIAQYGLPDTNRVATVCYASKDPEGSSMLEPLVSFLKRVFGLPSDGMVPFADSIIPGSEAVMIVGVDHAEPVLLAADKIAMFGAHLKRAEEMGL